MNHFTVLLFFSLKSSIYYEYHLNKLLVLAFKVFKVI